MKIDLTLNVSQEEIVSFLEKYGYEVMDMDFGTFSQGYHAGREQWQENICKGVITPSGKKKIEDAFAELVTSAMQAKIKEMLA